MKNFLKRSVAILAIAVVFSSCKKSSQPAPADNDVSSAMQVTVNGAGLFFNDCEEASAIINGVTQTVFVANIVTNGKPGDVSFEVDIVHNPATLQAGQTYQMIAALGQTTDGATLFYYPNQTDFFVTQPANPQGTVTITGVTDATISGTFSGKLFAAGDFAGATVVYTVTDGIFTAKRNTKP